MCRALPSQIRVLALIAALALIPGCNERKQLEKEAPALASADLTVDRIAIAGVVSDAPAISDSTASRERWSSLIGNHLGRERFGKLPIMSSSEVRAILGRDEYGLMLDRFKHDGECDAAQLADLHTLLEGKARFIVVGNIQDDRIEWSDSETEVVDEKTKKTTSRTKTMKTLRTTWVRLRFYDLADQQLVWDHLTIGQSVASKEHDMSDVIEHDEKEGFLGGLITSIANAAIKGDPKYPRTPSFESSLTSAYDNVGDYLKPKKKKK
jgi:hypothetical protein